MPNFHDISLKESGPISRISHHVWLSEVQTNEKRQPQIKYSSRPPQPPGDLQWEGLVVYPHLLPSFQGPLLCAGSWEGERGLPVQRATCQEGETSLGWLIPVVVHRRGVGAGFLKRWLVLSWCPPPGERQSLGGVLSLWPGSPLAAL